MTMEQNLSSTRVVDDARTPRLLRRKIRLEVLKGPNKGQGDVFGKEEINIGTLPSNDLVLSDSSVSRYHLRIATGASGFVLTDLDSTNGTYIGPIRIREVTVSATQELQMGDSVIRFVPLA